MMRGAWGAAGGTSAMHSAQYQDVLKVLRAVRYPAVFEVRWSLRENADYADTSAAACVEEDVHGGTAVDSADQVAPLRLDDHRSPLRPHRLGAASTAGPSSGIGVQGSPGRLRQCGLLQDAADEAAALCSRAGAAAAARSPPPPPPPGGGGGLLLHTADRSTADAASPGGGLMASGLAASPGVMSCSSLPGGAPAASGRACFDCAGSDEAEALVTTLLSVLGKCRTARPAGSTAPPPQEDSAAAAAAAAASPAPPPSPPGATGRRSATDAISDRSAEAAVRHMRPAGRLVPPTAGAGEGDAVCVEGPRSPQLQPLAPRGSLGPLSRPFLRGAASSSSPPPAGGSAASSLALAAAATAVASFTAATASSCTATANASPAVGSPAPP